MDEDKILQEIRKITLDDSLPLDKILRQVISTSENALKEYEKRCTDHTGIIKGNILTYLISIGIDRAMDIQGKTMYQIGPEGVGLIPYDQLYIYVKGTNSYLCSKSGQQFVLVPSTIPFLQKKENGSPIFIKYGMLFLNIDTNPHIVYIIPNTSLLKIFGRAVQPINSEHMITIPAATDDVIGWLYS